jgi:hypothetical protein
MVDNYVSVPGVLVTCEELEIAKAKAVALALHSLPYVHLLECRRFSDARVKEIVVFDTEVEVGQRPVYEIHPIERIAVVFSADDAVEPEVLALRKDFPQVPHLFSKPDDIPRRLCLYADSFDEVKLRLTAIRFIERIREWLALTAKGKLHQQDQPLEPLLLESAGTIVIPYDIFSCTDARTPKLLAIKGINRGDYRTFLIAEREGIESFQSEQLAFVATAFVGTPQQHGIFHRQPKNLCELHQFLGIETNLLSELRERLKIWQNKRYILSAKLALIIALPKKREESSGLETKEYWAFISTKTLKDIGEEIGIWNNVDGIIGTLILVNEEMQGQKIDIIPLRTMFYLTRDSAAALAGLPKVDRIKITAIGLGALGSQVFINLIRMGYGTWSIIDEDHLLPHNLSRHSLDGFAVGFPKTDVLAYVANNIIDGEIIATPIVANVLNPREEKQKVNEALTDTEVILDVSTSVAVERYLARDIESCARRISLFLNPSGSDVVMLAEDRNREASLDYLEMQYYRHLINTTGFEHHLVQNGNSIRYSNSCRDISSTISQEYVALHAAICSRALRNVLSEENCSIKIWQAEPRNLAVHCSEVNAFKMLEYKIQDWKLCTDQWFIDKIYDARKAKLPRETGGVLVGSFDMQRKIVYVVDAVSSPLYGHSPTPVGLVYYQRNDQ